MPNEIAELQLVVKSDQVVKADNRLRDFGKSSSRTEEQLERLDFTLGALNRNLLESSKKTNRLMREQIKATRSAKSATDQAKKQTKSTRTLTLAHVRNAAALGGVTFALFKYSRAIIQADKDNVRIRNSLMFVTGGLSGLNEEMEFLRKNANKYGQDIRTLAVDYAKFAAAAKGSNFATEETRLAFEGVASAAATLSLSAENTSSIMVALEQMLSKGTVQAQELKLQLGNALPGGFKLAADAAGMTTIEFTKFFETGNAISTEFLPKFSRQMLKVFGADIASKTDNLTAATNRLNNAIFELFSDERNILANSFKDIIVDLTETIKDPEFQSAAIAFNKLLGTLVKAGGFTFKALGNLPKNLTLSAVGADVSFKKAGLENRLSGETDPAKIAELRALIQAQDQRLTDAFNQLEPGFRNNVSIQGKTAGGIPAAPKGAQGTSAKEQARQSAVQERARGFFQDPEGRLDQRAAQFEEERAFLLNNQEILFKDEEDFKAKLLRLDEQFFEDEKELQKEARDSQIKGMTGRLGEARDFFSDLTVLAQGENKKLFIANRAFAIADATIKGIQAVQASAALGFPQNIPGVILETGRAAASIAAISSTQFAGNFKDGGFLGGPHASGDVMNFNGNRGEAILNPMQQREFMQIANGGGGGSGTKVSVNITNTVSNADVRATSDDSGNVEIRIIERAVNASVNAVARQMQTGSGAVANALEGPAAKRMGVRR